jgi:hypothetical protein
MSMNNRGGMISTEETCDSSGNTNSSHLVAKIDELANGMLNLAFQSIFVHTSKGFLIWRSFLAVHGAERLYFPSEGSRAADFIGLRNPSPSTAFESTKLWSNGKQANH